MNEVMLSMQGDNLITRHWGILLIDVMETSDYENGSEGTSHIIESANEWMNVEHSKKSVNMGQWCKSNENYEET